MNQSAQTSFLPSRKVAVKIHYSAISQFCYFWVLHDRPCEFTVKKSRQDMEYLGVVFKVENEETLELIQAVLHNIRGTQIVDL